MPYQAGQGKTAVALFVDGLELKYVQLSLRGSTVQLRDFKTVALVQKFEEKAAAGVEPEEAAGFGDLGTETFAAPPPTEAGGGEGNTNASVLLATIGDIPPTKYDLAFTLSEPAVTYHEFETDFGLKGLKLKKQLVQELSSMRSAPPALDGLDMIPTSTGGLLSVTREDGLKLYDVLLEIKPFIGNRLPNLRIIDSADVALMNFVRASYQLQEGEISVIAYVGNEFTRLIFMQGGNYLHFAPVISEGYNSPNIENTLYSRILLEQDNIALARIDRILLAGDGHKVNLREALAPQFSSSAVEYLTSSELDLSMFEESVGEALSEYSVPLATAWRLLQPAHPGFYDVNLIPTSILEEQKAFKLAWHGWLLAVLSMVSIVFFYTSIISRNQEIRAAQELLKRRQTEFSDLVVLRQQRDTLTAGIARFSTAAQVYDSIAPGGDRWSRILHYLSNSVEDLNSLWIYQIQQDAGNPTALVISGRSIYRTRIPRLASLFEKATLKAVRTRTIREKIVYEFDLQVDQIDRAQFAVPPRPVAGR
ncbi:MAG: hypothetical protein HYW57_01865 [Ignavibacteriales bacterium]|nr:hypothetical protein [Ignavibacteriales bacterium]